MFQQFDKHKIVHICDVDHPESIGVGPNGEAYTTGTGCQVYRLDLKANAAEQFASTKARCLGQVVDADGNLYAAHAGGGDVLKITPAGEGSSCATGPVDGRLSVPIIRPSTSKGTCIYPKVATGRAKLTGRSTKLRPAVKRPGMTAAPC